MREAGWQRATRFEDADGKPVQHRAERVYSVLTWWRGYERIEVWVAAGERAPHGSIYYTADERNQGMFMSVHTDWAEKYGIGSLQKLARAAGILTAPKKEEVAA